MYILDFVSLIMKLNNGNVVNDMTLPGFVVNQEMPGIYNVSLFFNVFLYFKILSMSGDRDISKLNLGFL